MYKLFCNRCKREIQKNDLMLTIEMGESDYLGEKGTLKHSVHRDFDLHLCNECRYELLHFLKLDEEEPEEALSWM
jgi:hypothetical protein